MPKCSCHHCKNRQIGCHKFCPDYRKYRREQEKMQADLKEAKEAEEAYISSVYKSNFKRK
jgi:hypothetical protein